MQTASRSQDLECYVGPNASEIFARHLTRNVADYYQDDRAGIELLRCRKRQNSTFFEFEVTTRSKRRTVLVKVPFGLIELRRGGAADRKSLPVPPRLFPKSLPDTKGEREYRALVRIHDHFQTLRDRRFGAIRMLDYLQDSGTLIMEKHPDPVLRSVFFRANRVQRGYGCDRLLTAVENAGRWLREYHQLTGFDFTQARNTTRTEFIEVIDNFVEFLLGGGRYVRFLQRLSSRLEAAAEVLLPEELPLGLNHCDYAPRNVLVDRSGRVTVFDTQSKWYAPIYEDVSRFVVSLKASGPQMSTFGLMYSPRQLAGYENAFLEGYFGNNRVPTVAIRLFECQHLLATWVSQLHHYRRATGARKLIKRSRLTLWSGYIARYISSTLQELPNHG